MSPYDIITVREQASQIISEDELVRFLKEAIGKRRIISWQAEDIYNENIARVLI
jgi:hypothetical protein